MDNKNSEIIEKSAPQKEVPASQPTDVIIEKIEVMKPELRQTGLGMVSPSKVMQQIEEEEAARKLLALARDS